MFSLSQSSAWQCCSTEAPWRSFINVKVTTTSKELPFHKRCQNAISPSTNWPPHLFVLNFTKRKAEFCPGFFPYFCPGLPQPLFQIPASHSHASACGAMGTSPAPHLLPSTLQQTLGACFQLPPECFPTATHIPSEHITLSVAHSHLRHIMYAVNNVESIPATQHLLAVQKTNKQKNKGKTSVCN